MKPGQSSGAESGPPAGEHLACIGFIAPPPGLGHPYGCTGICQAQAPSS